MRNPLVILLEVSGLVSIDECDYEHQSKLEVAVGCSWWSVNILAENEAACLLLATCGARLATGRLQFQKKSQKAALVRVLCVGHVAIWLEASICHLLLHLASFSRGDLRSSIAGEDLSIRRNCAIYMPTRLASSNILSRSQFFLVVS